MNLWRLELIRLSRTSRGIALLGAYVFFGVLGPLTAAYLPEILAWAGTEGVSVMFPDPTPIDGVAQFVSSTSQLGVLAVVIVAAAALAVDARPEQAAFLRTRVRRPQQLVAPRYVVSAAAAVVALFLGTGVMVGLTRSLLGALPYGEVVAGTLLGGLYLTFAVAVVAAVAGFVRTQLATVFVSIAALLVLPALGIIDAVAPYLPSTLVSAVVGVTAGEAVSEYLGATIVTLLATPGLVAVSVVRISRREI